MYVAIEQIERSRRMCVNLVKILAIFKQIVNKSLKYSFRDLQFRIKHINMVDMKVKRMN